MAYKKNYSQLHNDINRVYFKNISNIKMIFIDFLSVKTILKITF